MKITWEFCGGLLFGLGAATGALSYCFLHEVLLPGWLFIGGLMLVIAGGGITKGAQELQRKDKQLAENMKRTAPMRHLDQSPPE